MSSSRTPQYPPIMYVTFILEHCLTMNHFEMSWGPAWTNAGLMIRMDSSCKISRQARLNLNRPSVEVASVLFMFGIRYVHYRELVLKRVQDLRQHRSINHFMLITKGGVVHLSENV